MECHDSRRLRSDGDHGARGKSAWRDPKPGSMGKPMPGMSIVLLDPDGSPSGEGEVCIDLSNQPIGLTPGYFGDERTTSKAIRDGYYHPATSQSATTMGI